MSSSWPATAAQRDQAETLVGGDGLVAELTRQGMAHVQPHSPAESAWLRPAPPDLALQGVLAGHQSQLARGQELLLDGHRRLATAQATFGTVAARHVRPPHPDWAMTYSAAGYAITLRMAADEPAEKVEGFILDLDRAPGLEYRVGGTNDTRSPLRPRSTGKPTRKGSLLTSPIDHSSRSGMSVQLGWRTLADGLLVQRLYLHLSDWRDVIESSAVLPDILDLRPRLLACRPALPMPGDARSRALTTAAELEFWVQLPEQCGLPADAPNALEPAVGEMLDQLLGNLDVSSPEESLLRGVAAAAAWWVGFFAVIRHQGVHYVTTEPIEDRLAVTVLESAAQVVALGAMTRVVEAWARESAGETDLVRILYCRALTEAILAEREMPTLLAALGELRLVDLTTLAIPWRGRFTKYQGGAGAGQVE